VTHAEHATLRAMTSDESQAWEAARASDAELAQRIAAGTRVREAEAELCRRFAPRIRLYGLRHLRNTERALDLVQSVLLAVIEALRASRVDDPERLERFIFGTCRHMALRVHQSDARAAPTEPSALELGTVLMPSAALDIDALLRCMSALDVRARSVLHLSFYRDKSAGQIASVLETTPGNVRVVRHRAVADLRRCLDACEESAR
jgi:RNA polymerase sigma-70 factor (ECF subfamily)